MKVLVAVSHTSEPTLAASVASIERSIAHAPCHYLGLKVVAGVEPMFRSFNRAMEIALANEADVLVHTASDVLLMPEAVSELLAPLDLDSHYLSVGRGYDALHGSNAPIGLLAMNMRVLKEYRFANEFLMDLKLWSRVERATGLERVYTPKNVLLGYHHPVWQPFEMYAKYRYAFPKYAPGSKASHRMEGALATGLEIDPSNKALLAGKAGLSLAKAGGALRGAKAASLIEKEFEKIGSELGVHGGEFWVRHRYFHKFAQDIIDSEYECVTKETSEDPFPKVRLKGW